MSILFLYEFTDMSDYTQKQSISWDDIKTDSAALAAKLKAEFQVPDKILAITRGGLIPAALVTRSLNIKVIETMGIETYHDQTQSDLVKILKKCDPAFLKDTLIIDDLVDTGKTYSYLRDLTENCLFATLYAKPLGAEFTDCYVRDFEQHIWVDFPWEV